MNALREFFGLAKKKCREAVTMMSDASKPLYIQNVIASFFIAFFATSVIYIAFFDSTRHLEYTDLAFVSSQHILTFALTVVSLMAILMMSFFLASPARILPITLLLSVTTFCYMLQIGGQRNVWLGAGAACIIYIACRWLFSRFEKPFEKFKISFDVVKIFVVIMFVNFVGYMSIMGICRYYSFTYDTFDFGIFAQMFDYMKETGLPYTTVERNELLSHFAVHFSPFFYVLLPGYFLFSTPAYLCVVQTLFVGLGVFAVFGIAKAFGFSPKQTLLACALFLLYPSLSYGLYYDFHENKFLTFCILYALYFLVKRKFVPFYIFAVLLCTVKEDAAIYLVAISLFMLFHERLIKHGLFTLLLAVGYFVFALKMIEVCGATDGNQFGYRYSNFALDGNTGVGSIIKTTILDFGYTLSQIFRQEKMEFFLWMFLPVFFLPFMTKKVSALFMLTPMLLVNFMSSWPYQYDVDYQYTYGTAALIIVCSLVVLRQMSPKKRNMFLVASAALALVVTVPRVVDRNQGYIAGYETKKDTFQASLQFIDDNLSKESIIGAEGNVVPMLYDYPHLFLDPHNDELAAKIEYYIAKKDDGDIQQLVDRGFELVADNDFLVIYKNPAYSK